MCRRKGRIHRRVHVCADFHGWWVCAGGGLRVYSAWRWVWWRPPPLCFAARRNSGGGSVVRCCASGVGAAADTAAATYVAAATDPAKSAATAW